MSNAYTQVRLDEELNKALKTNQEIVVRLLIKNGANMRAASYLGLRQAVVKGHVNLVANLMKEHEVNITEVVPTSLLDREGIGGQLFKHINQLEKLLPRRSRE